MSFVTKRVVSAGNIGLPALAFLALAASSAGAAEPLEDPMRFFEGHTEGVSTVKIITKKAYQSKTIGKGTIGADGVLELVQRVEDEGKPPHNRIWHIREVAPGRFSGTMSEASGPVTIETVGGKFRLRFKMDGHISVEEWLTPHPGGRSASNKTTIKKFGFVVASSNGTIRKTSSD